MAAGAEHRVQCTRKTFGLDSMCRTCLVHTVHSQAGNQSVYETNCSMKHLCLPVIHKHLHNSAASSTSLAWLAPFRLFCWPSGYLNLSESHFVFPRSRSRHIIGVFVRGQVALNTLRGKQALDCGLGYDPGDGITRRSCELGR